MKRRTGVIIRPFAASLDDAEGLLLVERATFDECPYSPAEVQAMLTTGPQRAWLAVAGDQVVGFVAAFATRGLSGPCWEIDLLAVHPDWSRQGIASRLIRAASVHGARTADRARAVVALDNDGSTAAFERAGFRAQPEGHELFIQRLEEGTKGPSVTVGVTVREAAGTDEVLPWRPDLDPGANWQADLDPRAAPEPGSVSLLVAEQNSPSARRGITGYAELIWVQTLLYRGVWIESLAADTAPARGALVRAAVERAVAAGLDEIGAMAPSGSALAEALQAAGLASLGAFRWLVARLPLPGLAAPPPVGEKRT